MADMVVDVVGNRDTAAPPLARPMKGWNYLQLLALGPYRVVIVIAVDPIGIQPEGPSHRFGILLRNGGNRALDMAGQHHDPQPAFANGVFQLVDRLLRRMHRNHRDGRHPVGIVAEHVGVIIVQCTAGRTPHLFVFENLGADSQARIEHGEVQPDLAHPLVKQLGKQ